MPPRRFCHRSSLVALFRIEGTKRVVPEIRQGVSWGVGTSHGLSVRWSYPTTWSNHFLRALESSKNSRFGSVRKSFQSSSWRNRSMWEIRNDRCLEKPAYFVKTSHHINSTRVCTCRRKWAGESEGLAFSNLERLVDLSCSKNKINSLSMILVTWSVLSRRWICPQINSKRFHQNSEILPKT